MRIAAQLNDVATGSHLWAERFDRRLADVFAVQDEITEAIVAAIEPKLYAAENFRAQRKPPDSIDAWDLVMRALSHYWRVTRQDHVVAQALLEKAITIDPDYGQALGVLAASHMFSRAHGLDGHGCGDADGRARGAGAPSAPTARIRGHIMRSATSTCSTRRFEDSLAEFELALALNPNFLAGARLSTACRCPIAGAGRRRARPRAARIAPQSARPVCRRLLLALPPTRSSSAATTRRRCGWRGRRSASAADFVGAHRVLTAAAGMAGDSELAQAALRELRRAQPNISLAWIAEHMPIKHDAEREHYLEGFRRAALE